MIGRGAGGKGHRRQLPRRWSPRRWALWSQRPRVIVYLLAVEAAALVSVVTMAVDVPPPGSDQWWRFGLLTICAIAHLRASHGIERRRRDLGTAPHIDLTSIWSFAAVLVLHPLLILAVIGVLRVDRWFLARRPPFRFLLSAASHVLSAMLAAAVLHTVAGSGLMTGWYGSASAVATVGVTGATYFVVQLLVISVVILLAGAERRWSAVLGTAEANALEAATICLGCFAGLALVQAPLLLVAMVPAALVVHRTVLIRQLQTAAEEDPKTCLLNAAGWRKRAEREVARASRQDQPLGLLVIDLDHFKRVNDVHGYLAGDEVLRAVAGVLTAETREYDVVGRVGGEEFAVLLPGTDADGTTAAAERIRRAVEQVAVPVEVSNVGTVVIDGLSLSIGACCYPEVATTLEQFVTCADNALFVAKEAGRGQIRLIRGQPHG